MENKVYLVNLGALVRVLTTESGKQTIGRYSEDDDRVCVILEFNDQKWLIVPASDEYDRYDVIQELPEKKVFRASLADVVRDFFS